MTYNNIDPQAAAAFYFENHAVMICSRSLISIALLLPQCQVQDPTHPPLLVVDDAELAWYCGCWPSCAVIVFAVVMAAHNSKRLVVEDTWQMDPYHSTPYR